MSTNARKKQDELAHEQERIYNIDQFNQMSGLTMNIYRFTRHILPDAKYSKVT